MAVAREDRDPVTGPETEAAQAGGEPVHLAAKRGIGPCDIAADDRGPLAMALRRAGQHGRKRLGPGPGYDRIGQGSEKVRRHEALSY